MSRRRAAAIAALIAFPVVVVAIVLTSGSDGGSSKKKAVQSGSPALPGKPRAQSGATGTTSHAAPESTQTGGAGPLSTPLPVLDAGAPPKGLDKKIESGGAVNLADLRGTPIVLNIWSARCLPCREETRFLESEWERLGSRGVLFLGLNVLDSPDAARRFRAENAVTYPSLGQQRAETARQLGARGVPETFFISGEGKIVSHVIGAVSLAQIELGIDAAKTGRSRPTDQGGGQIPLR